MRDIIVLVVASVLVYPTASVLYVLLGGGINGILACFVLGLITYMAIRTLVSSTVEFYRWRRDMTRQKKAGMVNSKYGTTDHR